MSARALAVGSDKSSIEKGFRSVAPSVEDGAGSVMIYGSERVQPKQKMEGKDDRKTPTAFLRSYHYHSTNSTPPGSELMVLSTEPISQGLSGRPL